MKLRDLLEYVYAGLWEYILIVKVYFWLLSEYWVQNCFCLWRLFIIHLLNFFKPAWYSNFSDLSDSHASIPVYLFGLCMMAVSVSHEKIKKIEDKQGFT